MPLRMPNASATTVIASGTSMLPSPPLAAVRPIARLRRVGYWDPANEISNG